MTTIEIIRNAIETTKTRSAWDRGVNAYAPIISSLLL